MIVDHFSAEGIHDSADTDHNVIAGSALAHMPNIEKKIEKAASKVIMRNMDSTTERVVSLPTLSAFLSTRNPSKQPTSAIRKAKIGALISPTSRVFMVIAD